MPEDPIVEEIHKVREKLLEEYGGFDGYLKHIDELQKQLADRVVTRAPRRPVATGSKVR